jgi:hypothetical protein
MGRKLSRNAPCPCGSGKKYKNCCIAKDFEWVEMDDGAIGRQIQLSDESMRFLDKLRHARLANPGRESDLIFEGAPPLELIEHWTVEAMKKAGIEPGIIYAYEKTNGLLVFDANESKMPDTDISEWDAAIDEYEVKTGTKATRRRLNDDDFRSILKNGPKDKLPPKFVESLAIPPPFSPEEWGKRPLTSVIDEPKYFEYLQNCLAEVTRSGRAQTYLKMFCLMAHAGGMPDDDGDERDYDGMLGEALSREFTIEELRTALDSVAASFGPNGAMPTAAAAFEFLGFLGDFMNTYVEHRGIAGEFSDVLQKINGLAIFAFVAAVNAELGIQRDIWNS